MGPRPLKNFPKHQRVLRFTSSYYYGRWCIFRVVSRLAGFLFDDVQVWPSPAGYLAPLFAVRQRSRRIDLVLSRIKPRQLTSARSLRMKKRSGLHTGLPEDSSYVWEKNKLLLTTILWVKRINTDIRWRWKTTDAMFSCNLWDNEMHKDWELFVHKKTHFFRNLVER